MTEEYIPERGDIVWISFDPSAGTEIQKQRPALVLSSRAVNENGFAFCVPITSNTDRNPLLFPPLEGTETKGCLVPLQMRSLDYRARNAELKEQAPDQVVERCADLFKVFLKIPPG